MYYLYSENKDDDQLLVYREADLCLCFRICKSRFSHFVTNLREIAERQLVIEAAFALSGLADSHCHFIMGSSTRLFGFAGVTLCRVGQLPDNNAPEQAPLKCIST